jgi:hypothetical protein
MQIEVAVRSDRAAAARPFRLLAAASGIGGVIALGVYFGAASPTGA